jgi:adenine-specific DNA-methyltransferase
MKIKLEEFQYQQDSIQSVIDVYLASDGEKEKLIYLDNHLSEVTLEYLKTKTSQKLIVLERSLDTTKKWNLKHYLGEKFNAF